ncbi:hypothetical protein [Aeromicrobium wangtongii]|uniref:Minor tail protein n=1 Tax=Aeromicrobium wangtongii TaxID=2969247 RepID=A0ABY5MAQ6_9ACTN|nr:hypothetical protein [Aeromicrobium wangtongii]MCD9199474.1 hypothetical protein [Aeromicrobium wangtongii]UUP13827.1 hypothetical protein NQV15_00510 [Aeromicrobium wangtongii]
MNSVVNPVDQYVFFGHSFIYLGLGEAFGALTGKAVYNGGIGGQKSRQIAARFNAPSAKLTTAVTMPATAGTAVTIGTGSSDPSNDTITSGLTVKPTRDGASYDRAVVLAGRTGRIQQRGTTIQFVPDRAGRSFAVPIGTPVTFVEGEAYRDRIAVLMVNRNDDWVSEAGRAACVANTAAMIARLKPVFKKVWVLEEAPSADDTPTRLAALTALNDALEAQFPVNFLRLMSWMRTTAAADAAGITFDADNLTDIAAGLTPRAFRTDALHLNALGNSTAAIYLQAQGVREGWLPPPPAVTATIWTSDEFTGGDASTIDGRNTDVGRGGSAKTWVVNAVSSLKTQMAIAGGVLVRGADPNATLAGIAAVPADAQILAKLAGVPASGSSLALRRSALAGGSSNRYELTFGVGNVRLRKVLTGNVATDLSGSYAISPGDVVGFWVLGTTIGLVINGVTRATATNADISGAGFGGFQTASSNGAVGIEWIDLYTVAAA